MTVVFWIVFCLVAVMALLGMLFLLVAAFFHANRAVEDYQRRVHRRIFDDREARQLEAARSVTSLAERRSGAVR